MEDGVNSLEVVKDALLALFDHSNHTLQKQVKETYIRHLYQPHLSKGIVKMHWHWSNLLATWQYWEDSLVNTLDASVVDSSDGLDAKQWGAMVILTSLSVLSSAVSVVLKEACGYTSSGSGNALHVAFVSDDVRCWVTFSNSLDFTQGVHGHFMKKPKEISVGHGGHMFGLFSHFMQYHGQSMCFLSQISSLGIKEDIYIPVDDHFVEKKNLERFKWMWDHESMDEWLQEEPVDKLEVSSSMCFAKVGGKRQSVAADGFPIQDGNTMETGNTGTPKITLEGLFEMDKEDNQVGKAKEEGLDVLREALCLERNMLVALEIELENERNAAAIATSEAMAIISRLQEEKSAMQLEVAQLQRIAKEKAEYDEHAIALLKEILFKRGAKKHALEKEVELYRERLSVEKVKETKNKGSSTCSSTPLSLLNRIDQGPFSSERHNSRPKNVSSLDQIYKAEKTYVSCLSNMIHETRTNPSAQFAKAIEAKSLKGLHFNGQVDIAMADNRRTFASPLIEGLGTSRSKF
ncbi:hypothetical protein L7F22_030193 [Adiantum nelumboides]|nr:hypothetical protein [Adiantum nelumboides]